jgi:hypothetical protein
LTINSILTGVPFDFNVTFRTTRYIGENEVVVVRLPRFTRSLLENTSVTNITYGNLIMSPSYNYAAKWSAGMEVNSSSKEPFPTAELHIQGLYNTTFSPDNLYNFIIYKENGIGARCGFPSSDTVNATGKYVYPFSPFEILTALSTEAPTSGPTASPTTFSEAPTEAPTEMPSNPTAAPTDAPTSGDTAAPTVANLYYRNDSYLFEFYTGVGQGCVAQKLCSGAGQCDYCHEQCHCFNGYGSKSDLVNIGRDLSADCSSRKFFKLSCLYLR